MRSGWWRKERASSAMEAGPKALPSPEIFMAEAMVEVEAEAEVLLVLGAAVTP